MDVIRNAGDRQADHLRTFQMGKHGTLSQQLLTEVAEALACLLDPAKKAAYDRELAKCIDTATQRAGTYGRVARRTWLSLAIVWAVLVLAGALGLSEWSVSKRLGRVQNIEESRAKNTRMALEEMSASFVELRGLLQGTLADLRDREKTT